MRHLREKHRLSHEEARTWKKSLRDKIRDISYDPWMVEFSQGNRAEEVAGKASCIMV